MKPEEIEVGGYYQSKGGGIIRIRGLVPFSHFTAVVLAIVKPPAKFRLMAGNPTLTGVAQWAVRRLPPDEARGLEGKPQC